MLVGRRDPAARHRLRAAIYDRLTRSLGKEPETATPRDIYDALSLAVREELSARWLATQRRVARARVKRLCYLSVEFLPGRSLVNALSSLDAELIDEARAAIASMGHDFDCRDRARGRSRPRQRRSRPARGVFPRFARDAAVPGHRLRHPLRLRHLHAVDRHRRRAARIGEHLAAPAQRLGDAAVGCALHRALRRTRLDDARRPAARRARAGSRRTTCSPSDSISSSRATAARRSITCACGRRARCSRSTSRTSTPATIPRRSRIRSKRRICRACCIRTTPRRRARSCASSSNTSS